ncbi:MAG: hypothetical protein GY762_03260 [Proteobacteria bacterium]|nr:hypothetical protein [Pseudomonadota bacterium]
MKKEFLSLAFAVFAGCLVFSANGFAQYVCTDDTEPSDPDSDEDGAGDHCDFCEGAGAYDIDGDGLCDGNDNCPGTRNPDQLDSNGDGFGDLCANGIDKIAPIETFKGTWHEIGRQVGRTFPDNIIDFGKTMDWVLYDGIGASPGHGWTPQTLYDYTVEDGDVPQSVQDHMQGMAQGISEVRPITYKAAWDLVLTQNMAVDLINMGSNMTVIPEWEAQACTAFGVISPAGAFLAHNTDATATDVGNTSAIMFWQPTNGDFAYMTMDPPGWADVAFGLNEKGIAVTMNAGSPNKNAVMGAYSNFLLRSAMEHAQTLEDAVGLFEDHIASGKTFSATGSIIHFMDFNQNKMAKIQLASEEIDVTYGKPLGSDTAYIGSANHFVDGFKADTDFFHESSFARYARLVELMEQEMDTFDLDGCWTVLSDTNGGGSTTNTISRTSTAAGSGSTVFGTIFTEDGLHYTLGPPHAYLSEYDSTQFVSFAELQREANKSGSDGTCHVTSVGSTTTNTTGLLLLGLVGFAAIAIRRRRQQ